MAAAAENLLAADEPSPVRVLHEAGASDLLLTADHAGRIIPRRLGRLGLPESELDRHIAWDIGIAGVTERLSAALDATAVLQTYSRLVIDCNRDPSVASAMPEVSETTPIPGNVGLSEADRAARVREIFAPYHARIEALLDARAAAGRRTVLVAMHSFTPVFKGESRAMQVGVLFNRDVRLASALLALLRAEGDIVGGRERPLCGDRHQRLRRAGARGEARPAACRNRDPPGPDRGRARPDRHGRPASPACCRRRTRYCGVGDEA